MCLQDLMRELYAKADALRPLPSRREKDVPRGPIPFSLDELESYLEHFKTCRYVHFPDPQVRYYRKFSKTCRLHADYVASFDEVRMIDICCGERIPECDYVKLGEEEKRYLELGYHISGFRHIYLELEEAFRTSKRGPNRKNFPASAPLPDEEELEEKRLEAEKKAKESAELWVQILAKEYEKSQLAKANRPDDDDEDDDEEEVEESANDPEPKPIKPIYASLTRQRSETV